MHATWFNRKTGNAALMKFNQYIYNAFSLAESVLNSTGLKQ